MYMDGEGEDENGSLRGVVRLGKLHSLQLAVSRSVSQAVDMRGLF